MWRDLKKKKKKETHKWVASCESGSALVFSFRTGSVSVGWFLLTETKRWLIFRDHFTSTFA